MSGTPISPVSQPATVRADIARAAERTGEDFNFLLAQARIESSLNPNAKAGTSSAAGLYQFTKSTWLGTLERHGSKHGFGWASAAISNGRITDPRMSERILSLRYDPAASSLMAGELAGDNRDDMTRMLGRQPVASELYLGHFLGSGDASRFLSALERDPAASASDLFPSAASANRAIFFDGQGRDRSLREVMNLVDQKVASAMQAGGDFDPAIDPISIIAARTAPVSAIPTPMAPAMPVANHKPRTMSASLDQIFGGAGRDSAPPAIKAAYARFEKFGL